MGEILRSRTLALGLLITLVVVLGIAIGPMVTPFPAFSAASFTTMGGVWVAA